MILKGKRIVFTTHSYSHIFLILRRVCKTVWINLYATSFILLRIYPTHYYKCVFILVKSKCIGLFTNVKTLDKTLEIVKYTMPRTV